MSTTLLSRQDIEPQGVIGASALRLMREQGMPTSPPPPQQAGESYIGVYDGFRFITSNKRRPLVLARHRPMTSLTKGKPLCPSD